MLTDRLNLRGGHPCWEDLTNADIGSDTLPTTTDIAIVGAGIMGAMLAERLAVQGREVAIFDRRRPVTGSTAASTALVMWAADVPLTHLAARIGSADAVRAWRRVHRAVTDLNAKIVGAGMAASWRARPELYLAGDLLDDAALEREALSRASAGLPSSYLRPEETASRFSLPPRAAILSGDSYEVDPVALTLTLFETARSAGASLCFPHDIIALNDVGSGAVLSTSDGRSIKARTVILATGYEAARWYLPPAFSLGSSFAISSEAGIAPLWRENALIWEASDRYLYARTSADGRIIVGGGDEGNRDATARDGRIEEKRGALEAAAAAFVGSRVSAQCAWGATFGRSPDGLPAIGRARNAERVWLAAGFGGKRHHLRCSSCRLTVSGGGQDRQIATRRFSIHIALIKS